MLKIHTDRFRGRTKEKKPADTAGKELTILLLTNRDSDNLGDLVIEACDICLIQTVMKNLGIPADRYRIVSRAASIISRKYVITKDDALLDTARSLLSGADLIFFGGAPMFNYSYQIFYERTAVTLELAQQYGKPVLFSAMGVEKYDGDDPRCQRLKKTLNLPCVRRITTRDDYPSLRQYVTDERIFTAKVADPAVYCAEIFRDFVSSPPKKRSKPKVGIFVLRSDGFKSNGISFTREDAVQMWLGLIAQLEKEGYDYTLLANGHFADEAFLDYLIREHGISSAKCVFNMDSPEKIVEKISIYDAVISCRLHPSILSWSLGIPSIGIRWNPKVAQFYEAVGCSDRTFGAFEADPEAIVSKLGEIIGRKQPRDEDYRMSLYTTLFDGFAQVMPELGMEVKNPVPYTSEQLAENLEKWPGTSPAQKNKYLVRKMRRTYDHYNRLEMAQDAQKREELS